MIRSALPLVFLAALSTAGVSSGPAFAVSPVVTEAIPDTTVVEDSPSIDRYRDLNRVFFDAEDGDSLAFTIALNSDPALVFATIGADSALDLSFAPNASGTAILVIRATDSEALWVEDTLTVNVTAVNDAPVVAAAIPDTMVLVDDPPVDNFVDLNDVFSDVENGSALTFTVQSNSDPAAVSVSIDADSALDLSFFPDTHGLATIVVRATDPGGLYAQDTFVVRVHRTLWLVKADGSGHEPTIQAAINVSLDGDTIVLADGTYTGGGNRGMDLGGRDVLITSQNGPATTIIDAQGADRVFLLDNVGPGGELRNITIKNGSKNQGSCLKMSNASPTLSGMIFVGSTAGKSGGAIWCNSGSSPTITGCVFIGNHAGENGGAIYASGSSPVIQNCTIVECSAGTGGAGIHMDGSAGLISNTIIAFSTQGEGLACAGGSNFTMSCTDIFGNLDGDSFCGLDGGDNFSADPRFCGAPGSGIVTIEGYSPCAPGQSPCATLVGALPPACALGPELADTPGTVYPEVTFAGDPGLVVHIGLDNFSPLGVMLDTTSTVVFSDSVSTFTSALANRTYIPGNARNFTVTFSPALVPAGIQAPASYGLVLELEGVDDSTQAYSAAVTTEATNSILVDTPKVIVSSLPLKVRTILPGERAVPLLALSFQNGYADARILDSLAVTNMTWGAGAPADLDAEIEDVYLFDDADSTGTLSAPDVLIAQSGFAAGRAAFALGGAWPLAAYETRNLIVTADIDSVVARDPDAIDAAVVSPADIVFQTPTQVNQDFSPLYPLDSFGYAMVDGMARHQIATASSPADTLVGGGSGVWVFTLVVPQNGYASDTLTALSIKNYAGDFSVSDITALRAYRDDGNGVFDPALDGYLGPLVYSGDRYQLSGLLEGLAPPARFFIAADVANHAVDGHHFTPGIPVGGIEVTSTNDGPVDAPAVSTKSYVFENPEVVEVTSLPSTPGVTQPGSANVRLLFLAVANHTLSPVTLDSLTLWNGSSGAGTPADLDHTLSSIRIFEDEGNGVIDGTEPLVADDLTFAGGSFTVAGLGLGLASDEIVHLLVAADIDSFCAADGDTLEIRVEGPQDVGIIENYPVTGSFPTATTEPRVINGMKAFQIQLFPGADSLVVTGGAHVLLLNAGIPPNGYASDELRTVTIRNEGTATSEHLARIALYADGGNGTYDAASGDDVYLGDFVENPSEPGRSFFIAGLSYPLSPPCGNRTRVFVAADIAQDYSVAGTLRFSIPVMGLGVASGNDGPIDAALVEPSMTLIPKPDRLTIFPYPVGDHLVYPGSSGNFNSGVGLYNGYSTALTLEGITLYQVGTASSGEVDSVFVYADSDGDGLFNPLSDARLAAATPNGVSYSFEGLAVGLESRKITYLFFTYDLPIAVTDSSSVDLRLFGPADISVDPPGSLVEGDFPINSPGTDFVDGMVASQIELEHVPQYNASPLNADVPALTLVVPPNGIWADRLDFLEIRNQGTAAAGTDIASVRLWREAGGDPESFDSGMEDPLDYLDWNGSGWSNPSPLGVSIPASGLCVHVTFSVSASPTDGVTVRAGVPLNGIEVASGNDGPIDSPVANSSQQTISTDPLIATLAADRLAYSAGQNIVLTMTARNEGIDTLFAVHPSLVSSSGTGNASVVSTPNPPAADLAPGTATTFVWTYSAAAAGDLAFCARAYSADSSAVSEESCTERLLLQNRAAGITVALINVAPSSANRGQDGVGFFGFNATYASSDSLDAPIDFRGFRLRIENASGSALAANTVLDRIAFVEPGGIDHVFPLADSTNSTLELRTSQPVILEPGSSIALGIDANISDAAAFTSIVMKLASIGDVRLFDANDGSPAASASGNAFPWSTTAVTINASADTLLVDSPSGAPLTANAGQENLRVLSVDLTHSGNPNSAGVILNGFRLEFFDLLGSPTPPTGVIKRLRVVAGAAVLYDADVVSGGLTGLTVTLATPIVLSPASTLRFDFIVDLKSVPDAQGFYMVLTDPSAVVARDINNGQLVGVAPSNPQVRVFPYSSDRVAFQDAASGITAGYVERIPAVILRASHATPVMDVFVSHPGGAGASSVRIDSLAVHFSFSGGGPAIAGDYFSSVFITHEGDTVGTVTALGGASSAECRLTDSIVVAPAGSETLSVYVDSKPTFSPATIDIAINQMGLVVRDVNDGSRIFGLSGPFPFIAGPASLQLPGASMSAGIVSRLPANVTSSQPDVDAFDLVLKNGDSAGHSAVSLKTVRVRTQLSGGTAADPSRTANAARLIAGGNTLADGAINSTEIVFTLPDNSVLLQSGESDTLSLHFDLDADLDEGSFRFVIENASALEAVDAAVGSSVPVGTIGAEGYPLSTTWTHVLGRSLETAYTNYPNPFAAGRERTTITYYLEQKSKVTLKLYTVWGAPVVTLVENKSQDPGLYQNVSWDGRNGDGDVVNNGVYFLVLEIRGDGGDSATLKRKVGVIR